MRDGYGRTLKKRRIVPKQYRTYRQNKEEEMTEDERTQASKRLERRLQELDSKRLKRISRSFWIEKILCGGLIFFVVCAVLGAVVMIVWLGRYAMVG